MSQRSKRNLFCQVLAVYICIGVQQPLYSAPAPVWVTFRILGENVDELYTNLDIDEFTLYSTLSDDRRRQYIERSSSRKEYLSKILQFQGDHFNENLLQWIWNMLVQNAAYEDGIVMEEEVLERTLARDIDAKLKIYAPISRKEALVKFMDHTRKKLFKFEAISEGGTYRFWERFRQKQLTEALREKYVKTAEAHLIEKHVGIPYVSPKEMHNFYRWKVRDYQRASKKLKTQQSTLDQFMKYYEEHPDLRMVMAPMKLQLESFRLYFKPLCLYIDDNDPDGITFQQRLERVMATVSGVLSEKMIQQITKDISHIERFSKYDEEKLKRGIETNTIEYLKTSDPTAYLLAYLYDMALFLKEHQDFNLDGLNNQFEKEMRNIFLSVQNDIGDGNIFYKENKKKLFHEIVSGFLQKHIEAYIHELESKGTELSSRHVMLIKSLRLAHWEVAQALKKALIEWLSEAAGHFFEAYTQRGSKDNLPKIKTSFDRAYSAFKSLHVREVEAKDNKTVSVDDSLSQSIFRTVFKDWSIYSSAPVGAVFYDVDDMDIPFIEIFHVSHIEQASVLPFYDPNRHDAQKAIHQHLMIEQLRQKRISLRDLLLKKYTIIIRPTADRTYGGDEAVQWFKEQFVVN